MAGLVIQEVFGGGGKPGTQQITANIPPTYKNDYIVIYNASDLPISLAGISLQIQNGPGLGAWTVIDLSLATVPTVPAYGYFLVKMSPDSTIAGGASLPTPDYTAPTSIVTPALEMGFQNGKVALTTGNTALVTTGTITVGALSDSSTVIDLAGYGNANVFEGAVAPAPGTTTSIFRNAAGGWDLNTNSTDFASHTPAPHNSSSAPDSTGAPTVTSAASASLNENSQSILSVTATDPENLSLSYSVLNPASFASAGADGAKFSVNASTGALTFTAAPNFEAGTGHGANLNEYLVTVRVTDAGGASRDQLVTVTVNDVNEFAVTAPSDTNAAANAIDENTTGAVGITAQSSDADGSNNAVTYSLVTDAGGATAYTGPFSIDAATGIVSLNTTLNFEVDGPSQTLFVKATSADTSTAVTQFTVAINDLNEFPVSTPADTNAAANAIDENSTGTVGLTAHATDADGSNNTVTYSLVTDAGGLTAYTGPFSIDTATGVVSLDSAVNFETDGPSQTLFVKATSTDTSAAVSQFTVVINDVNEAPTAFTASNLHSLAENTAVETVVADLTITDPDTAAAFNAYTYSVSDNRFDVVGGQLVLKAGQTVNYETEPSILLTVTATNTNNATHVISTPVTVTVTNVNEAPTAVALGNTQPTLAENSSTAAHIRVGDITVTDDAIGTNSLTVSGADEASFEIFGGSLYLKAGVALDALVKPTYAVTVEAIDNTIADSSAVTTPFTLTITEINNAPTAVAITGATTTIAENTATATHIKVGDISVTDDGRGTNSLSLSGADAASFEFVGTELFVKAGVVLNFEAQPSYAVTVTAADGAVVGSTPVSTNFTLFLTDINEAPSITSAASASIAENTTAVLTVTSTDPDAGATKTFALAGGADAALFQINSSTGALSFIAAPNFEAPADVGANNIYNVNVQVSDGALTATQAVAVTVTDANEAPTITGAASANVAENTTAVLTVTATDPDAGATQTYTLAGGADAALFAINASTGALSFVSAPNFEAPTDAGGNNVYDVNVQVSDGTLTATQAIAVTVNDVNDVAPVITTLATQSVAENTTLVAALTSTDADTVGTNPATFTISGGANAALFTISGGNLVFNAGRDFETEAHSYIVDVQANDGANTTIKTIAVNLTDVNDTAPVITTQATQNVAENTTFVAALTSTDADTLGLNPRTFTVSGGADAALFDVVAGNLVFKAAPDFESLTHGPAYTVGVAAFDGVNTTNKTMTVNVTNGNEAPTAVNLSHSDATFLETASTAAHIKVADITVVDDGLGTNSLGLTGADAASFEITGTELFLKAGVHLDFETKTSYQVAVTVDDVTIGGTPDATSAVYTLNIGNVSPEILIGTVAADTLSGGIDKDLIFGLGGRDTLNGGAGDDTLTGGLGRDVMTGGFGSDTFDFDQIVETGKTAAARDVIVDFQHGFDHIDLSGIDAKGGVGGNQTFKFIAQQAFHHLKGELHYAKVNLGGTAHDKTIVEGDVNGDGKADFQIELKGLINLSKGDFIL